MADNQVREAVKNFYEELSTDKSLDPSVVNDHQLPAKYNEIITQLHPETMKRYYGSGFIIPDNVQGFNVVDLGCGSGSLVYILSKLVGQNGFVTGVDITPNLISEAKKYMNYHLEKWAYSKSNMEFHLANIENFDEIGLTRNSLDVVVSNGVICLCPNQRSVFQNVYDLLKDGGEFCLSDVYADRDRPEELKFDQYLFSQGTTGSMKWDEVDGMPCDVGFTKPYLYGAAPVVFPSGEKHDRMANSEFVCAEWRYFKLPKGARRAAAEVTYNGDIFGSEEVFRWDINLSFKKGEPVVVDSDLATILAFTRYKDSFSFKDTTTTATNVTVQNPFEYLEKLKAEGIELKPVYKIL